MADGIAERRSITLPISPRMSTIMKEKDLDLWFNSLELKQLERMFVWPYGADANDFIDYCDICWGCYTKEEKEGFYWRHSDDS